VFKTSPTYVLALLTVAAALVGTQTSAPADVLTYHGDAARSGHFVVPALTWDRARALRLDDGFRAKVSGHVYAQPVYWRGSGSIPPMLVVATEDNVVHAIDARSGNEIWKRALGKPVPRGSLLCGNISPLGVTGTPVIDPTRQAIYLDAAVQQGSTPRHLVFALSLKDGWPLAGWPVDVAQALGRQNRSFTPRDQNQRAALTIFEGRVYVAFGGHFGDCGEYRGVVLGISLANPTDVASWMTRARGGGIWAPAGISSDGASLYAATGNTFGASSFSDGEMVARLAGDLHRSESKRDYFAPSDWRALDARDVDLGGTAPLPFDVPRDGGTQALVAAFGKDGKIYVLDRGNLGGIGGQLVVDAVSSRSIITAPTIYPADDGVFIALHADGSKCPQRASGLLVLKVRGGSPPSVSTAWCATVRGAGATISTTTDGRANPIVWMLGAEGDNRLHAFRGDTGEALFSGPSLSGLRHFQTVIATEDRIYVAADGAVYAFGF
jgi:outer membrane protein assembly factor BamB